MASAEVKGRKKPQSYKDLEIYQFRDSVITNKPYQPAP
jgi:hypothetical protein